MPEPLKTVQQAGLKVAEQDGVPFHLVVMTVRQDGELIDHANMRFIQRELDDIGEDPFIVRIPFGYALLLNPCAGVEAVETVHRLLATIQTHLVLDDDLYQQMRADRADEIWHSASLSQRLAFCLDIDADPEMALDDELPDGTTLHKHLLKQALMLDGSF